MMAGDLCDTRTDMRIATSFLMARSQSRLTLEQSLPVTEIAALHILYSNGAKSHCELDDVNYILVDLHTRYCQYEYGVQYAYHYQYVNVNVYFY